MAPSITAQLAFVPSDSELASPASYSVSTPISEDGERALDVVDLSKDILDIYCRLAEAPDLHPGKLTNTLFTRLVNMCIQPRNPCVVEDILANPEIKTIVPHLRDMCSEGESALEAHWAKEILSVYPASKETVHAHLQSFPYYSNYVALSRLESSILSGVLSSPARNIAFIGSGPLPLTSFCLLSQLPQVQITNIDRDAEAIRLSSLLSHRLGYSDRIKFVHESAMSMGSLKRFDVVFLAALVGMSAEEKLGILGDLVGRMRVGGVVCVRSAHSLRGLLYPVIEDTGDLRGIGLETLVVVHPWNEVVNSLVVMRVLDRE